jgi:hypothetical protein
MANDNASAGSFHHQTGQGQEWGRVVRLANDALTVVNAGDLLQIREHLEDIRDVATKMVKHERKWRKIAWLADDSLTALETRDGVRAREYLVAIRAVALCAKEA